MRLTCVISGVCLTGGGDVHSVKGLKRAEGSHARDGGCGFGHSTALRKAFNGTGKKEEKEGDRRFHIQHHPSEGVLPGITLMMAFTLATRGLYLRLRPIQ